MCVVSMVSDFYYDKWKRFVPPITVPYEPMWPGPYVVPTPKLTIPQSDIDEFYELLRRAREYDKKNHEPDCEQEEKRERLRKLAEELGQKIIFPE